MILLQINPLSPLTTHSLIQIEENKKVGVFFFFIVLWEKESEMKWWKNQEREYKQTKKEDRKGVRSRGNNETKRNKKWN